MEGLILEARCNKNSFKRLTTYFDKSLQMQKTALEELSEFLKGQR